MRVVVQGAEYPSIASAKKALVAVIGESDEAIPLTKSGAVDTDLAELLLLKATEELRYTLGLAYPAMMPDKAVAMDGHIDFAGEELLEKTAWSWMAKHRDIGLFHKDGTEGHATVVESYIYRGPDWLVTSPVDGREYTIKAGDWMLGTIWDQYGWQLVKEGLVRGWSPEGAARRAVPTSERLAELRS